MEVVASARITDIADSSIHYLRMAIKVLESLLSSSLSLIPLVHFIKENKSFTTKHFTDRSSSIFNVAFAEALLSADRPVSSLVLIEILTFLLCAIDLRSSSRLVPWQSQEELIDCSMETGTSKEKSYVHWTAAMDQTLSSILLDEQGKGHKAPNGWKSVAFTAVIKGMKDAHNLDFTKEKIVARLKIWNKYYNEVSAMLDTSGFRWDWERNTVKVDSEEVWANYVKAHTTVKHYRDKVIINWADLGTLCGNDRATAAYAATTNETVVEVNGEVVGEESNHPVDPSSEGSSRQRKRKDAAPTDAIANAIEKMANSMEVAAAIMNKGDDLVPPVRVYEALATLPDMPETELVRAMDLLGRSQHKFDTFMALPPHFWVTWLHLQFYGP